MPGFCVDHLYSLLSAHRVWRSSMVLHIMCRDKCVRTCLRVQTRLHWCHDAEMLPLFVLVFDVAKPIYTFAVQLTRRLCIGRIIRRWICVLFGAYVCVWLRPTIVCRVALGLTRCTWVVWQERVGGMWVVLLNRIAGWMFECGASVKRAGVRTTKGNMVRGCVVKWYMFITVDNYVYLERRQWKLLCG